MLNETEEQIQRVSDSNTISYFLTVKEFLPAMVTRNHRHIVTVASKASHTVQSSNVDYCCTKASAMAFHGVLGQEIKSRTIDNFVNPAYVRTPLLQDSLDRPSFSGFMIEPEMIADVLVQQLHSGGMAVTRFRQAVMPRLVESEFSIRERAGVIEE